MIRIVLMLSLCLAAGAAHALTPPRPVDAPLDCPRAPDPPAATAPDGAWADHARAVRRHLHCRYHARLDPWRIERLRGHLNEKNEEWRQAHRSAQAHREQAWRQLIASAESRRILLEQGIEDCRHETLEDIRRCLFEDVGSLPWVDCSRHDARARGGREHWAGPRQRKALARALDEALADASRADPGLAALRAALARDATPTPPAGKHEHDDPFARALAHAAQARADAPWRARAAARPFDRATLEAKLAAHGDYDDGPFDGAQGRDPCRTGARVPANPKAKRWTSAHEARLAVRVVARRFEDPTRRTWCAWHGVQAPANCADRRRSDADETCPDVCNWTARLRVHPYTWLQAWKRERALACQTLDPREEEIAPWLRPRCHREEDARRRRAARPHGAPHWKRERAARLAFEQRVVAMQHASLDHPGAADVATATGLDADVALAARTAHDLETRGLAGPAERLRCHARFIETCALAHTPAPPLLRFDPWTSPDPDESRSPCAQRALESTACAGLATPTPCPPGATRCNLHTDTRDAAEAAERAAAARRTSALEAQLAREQNPDARPGDRERTDCATLLAERCLYTSPGATEPDVHRDGVWEWNRCPAERTPCARSILESAPACRTLRTAWRDNPHCRTPAPTTTAPTTTTPRS